MDGGSSLNLIYQDTIHGMGLDPTQIRHSNTTFKGVTPGPGARCTGSLSLQVTFGSPDNFRREHLTFHIALFQSGYQALLGREAFSRFNAIPHYASSHSRCPVHVASLQCTEISSALCVPKRVRLPWQPNIKDVRTSDRVQRRYLHRISDHTPIRQYKGLNARRQVAISYHVQLYMVSLKTIFLHDNSFT